MSNANRKQGRWISMFQDFHFKIIQRPKNKHSNVDVLSRNHVFVSKENEDFQTKIPNQTLFSSKVTI
jgi:hypothetical protein